MLHFPVRNLLDIMENYYFCIIKVGEIPVLNWNLT